MVSFSRVYTCTVPDFALAFGLMLLTVHSVVSGKGPFQLHLRVQVYPLDYHALGHPASRFLLTLQLRRDLLENR